jgi:hypothetical protein
LREVYSLPERIGNGGQIHLVAVRSQLHAIGKARGYILKEVRCIPGVPPSRKPANNQLAIGIDCDKRPRIARVSAILEMFWLRVLRLGSLRTTKSHRPGRG